MRSLKTTKHRACRGRTIAQPFCQNANMRPHASERLPQETRTMITISALPATKDGSSGHCFAALEFAWRDAAWKHLHMYGLGKSFGHTTGASCTSQLCMNSGTSINRGHQKAFVPKKWPIVASTSHWWRSQKKRLKCNCDTSVALVALTLAFWRNAHMLKHKT